MRYLLYILGLIPFLGLSQSGIHKDDSQVVAWATKATVVRGSQHIGTDSLNVTTGETTSVIGKADGDVVSLGDGGYAIVKFAKTIINKPGPDFAIFENGINSQSNGNLFMELAFVEVSSNGVDFVRFPTVSNTTKSVGTFGFVNTDSIQNFAGMHPANYGTPFDLELLKDSSNVDISRITHIKIVDVIGATDSTLASRDINGNFVIDPFPTPFNSGGFDLDAIGVISEGDEIVGIEDNQVIKISIQNPVVNYFTLYLQDFSDVILSDLTGRILKIQYLEKGIQSIDLSSLSNGIFILNIKQNGNFYSQKIVKL